MGVMRCIATCLLGLNLVGFASADLHKQQTLDNVISKIIEMLASNKDKIAADIESESKIMAEYFGWCDDEQSETGYQIRTATRKIEDLGATIEDKKAQIHGLDEEITKLGTELAERQSEIDEANKIREKQHAEFLEREKEQTAMVEELEQMEIELKNQMAAMTTPPPVGEETTPAPASALQQGSYDSLVQLRANPKHKPVNMQMLRMAMTKMVNAVWVDPQSQKALGRVHGLLQEDGLMQSSEDPEATPVPTVELGAEQVGQMQQDSENNLAAFEMLKGKAAESLDKLRDSEKLEQHNHDLRIQSLLDAIHLAEDKTDDAKRERSRLAEEQAKAEKELADTQASKAADEKKLEGLTTECNEGSASWATRQTEAKAEMAAIGKAKEILASRVTVLVQKNTLPLDQPVDVMKVEAATSKTRTILIDHFRMLGSELHSLALLNLVSVASTEPLAAVKNLLNDLITKLTKEAAEAANLHAFCQEEKAKTKEAKEKKTATIDKLQTRLDKASSKKDELAEAVAELSAEIAAMDKAGAEATTIRASEHEMFVKQEADFKEAADAVEDAIDALKDYYGDSLLQVSSRPKAALVQGSQHKAPPALGGAKSDAAGGILGIMETMQAEFRKTVSKLQSDEREAVKEYETMMTENKVSKAAKTQEIKGAESEIKSLTVAINNFGQDHKMATMELESILEYVQKLKPQCEGRTVPYAERKARREAEINGLKEALSIIEKDSPAMLAQVARHLRHARF